MDIQEEKQAELATIDRSLKAPYFFLRKLDNFAFAVDENQAWEILRGFGNWSRRDFVYLGHSDGSTYKRIMQEARNEKLKLKEDIDVIKADIVKFLKTEERLRFEELLDDSNDKVKRVKTLIAGLETKLEPLETKYNNFAKAIKDKAFNAELEVAKLDRTLPDNQDIITPEGNRKKILMALDSI